MEVSGWRRNMTIFERHIESTVPVSQATSLIPAAATLSAESIVSVYMLGCTVDSFNFSPVTSQAPWRVSHLSLLNEGEINGSAAILHIRVLITYKNYFI